MVVNEIYVPNWILKLEIFCLFIIVSFSAILIIVLLRALYLIKSSNPNANVAFIVVHIVMFTCVYALVCLSVFNIYSLSKAKTCKDLLTNYTKLLRTWHAEILSCLVNLLFVYFVIYRYSLASKTVKQQTEQSSPNQYENSDSSSGDEEALVVDYSH